ncbi:hypothetical protein MIDIC_70043 [Alphaproteobacteria bacterium]
MASLLKENAELRQNVEKVLKDESLAYLLHPVIASKLDSIVHELRQQAQNSSLITKAFSWVGNHAYKAVFGLSRADQEAFVNEIKGVVSAKKIQNQASKVQTTQQQEAGMKRSEHDLINSIR